MPNAYSNFFWLANGFCYIIIKTICFYYKLLHWVLPDNSLLITVLQFHLLLTKLPKTALD